MSSVTNRIKEIKQPRGGYVNPRKFREVILNDEKNLNDLVRTYLEKEGYIVYSFYTCKYYRNGS